MERQVGASFIFCLKQFPDFILNSFTNGKMEVRAKTLSLYQVECVITSG